MSEQKVSLWDKWKVHVAFIAGALVVSSVWGTCSYTPSVPVTEEKVEESAATTESAVTVPADGEAAPTDAASATATTETPVPEATPATTVVSPTVTVAKPTTTTK